MINHSDRCFQHQVTHNNIDQLPPAASFINNKKGPPVKLKSLSLSKVEDISEKYAKDALIRTHTHTRTHANT